MTVRVQQWEYRRERLTATGIDDLNWLGRRGWELVAVCIQNADHFAYLKRSLENVQQQLEAIEGSQRQLKPPIARIEQ